MLRMAFPLIMALATVLFAAGVQAAPACGKRDYVLAQLSEKYRETPVGIGLVGNGGLIELLTTKTGTTWTLIITLPNGPTCLLAAGRDWQLRQAGELAGPSI